MSALDDHEAHGLYADHAWPYWRAGWKGVLPMPATKKWPPPNGFTGHEGLYPDPGWIQRWTDEKPDGNLALRLPEHIVGIDVDDYDDKVGARTLRELEQRLGALPATVVSTSRTGPSGVRLFRCAPQSNWPSKAGADIEIISKGHRYVVAWPSIHPEGGTYRWIDQRTGETLDDPPDPTTLPELPAAWVNDLQSRATTAAVKESVTDPVVQSWLAGLRQTGTSCAKVEESRRSALEGLADGSRHDEMLKWSASLISLGAWGHTGVVEALGELHAEFFKRVLADGSRQESVAVQEWRRAVSGAVGMVIGDHPQPATGCVCDVTTITPSDEEDFWAARPLLTHIRQFMRARRASPWAGLGIVLVRAITAMPPHYVLPATIGGHGSLNLFLGLVARSGGGKGAADAAASDAVDVGEIRSCGVGSGEGILHQYVTRRKASKEDNLPAGIEQHTDRVLFTASEVDTLASLHARQSSTLLSELRKVWMAEELSFAYVDPTKRLTVGRHRYRAGLIVGIQPARAQVLLEDADGGTPQRFMWLPCLDPEMPDTAPEEPETWGWTIPTSQSLRVDGRVVLDVCATAVDTIEHEHVRRNRGEGDALDGHALMCRLKVAAGLAVLDERLDVNDDDWRLAGTVMAMSDHTRGQVINELRTRRSAANTAQGIADAEREVIRDETVAEAATRRVCQAITRKLDGGQTARAELRRALASRDRGFFDAAVERLVEAGQIEVIDGAGSTVYRTSGRS